MDEEELKAKMQEIDEIEARVAELATQVREELYLLQKLAENGN